jgi:hypothetical protein
VTVVVSIGDRPVDGGDGGPAAGEGPLKWSSPRFTQKHVTVQLPPATTDGLVDGVGIPEGTVLYTAGANFLSPRDRDYSSPTNVSHPQARGPGGGLRYRVHSVDDQLMKRVLRLDPATGVLSLELVFNIIFLFIQKKFFFSNSKFRIIFF